MLDLVTLILYPYGTPNIIPGTRNLITLYLVGILGTWVLYSNRNDRKYCKNISLLWTDSPPPSLQPQCYDYMPDT